MHCLQGFKKFDIDGHPMVCKLRLGLYGLVQAALLWNQCLVQWFDDEGFNQSEKDPCIFIRIRQDSKLIVPVHVDDLIPMGYPRTAIVAWEDSLAERFSIKRLGDAEWYSGIRIEKGPGYIHLSQEGYWDKMLDTWGMTDCRNRRQPLDAEIDLLAMSQMPEDPFYDPERADMSQVRSLIGGLSWPAEMTRPDLSFARAHSARVQTDCSQSAFDSMKAILRYVRSTKSHGIKFVRGTRFPNRPVYFVDSDFAGCRMTRRSTFCLIGIMNGGAYVWKSKLMPGKRPAVSTEEAEFVGLLYACRQAVIDRFFLEEIGYPQEEPLVIFSDNTNAVELANVGKITPSNKHIELRNHIVRFLIQSQQVQVKWIHTKSNRADIGTKAMKDLQGFELLRNVLVHPRPGKDSE